MKLLVIVLLAVLSTASKLTSASDTLSIDSYKVINTCSSDKTWLIAVSVGEVYASDSLMSFDIVIGYDTAYLSPTNALWQGTLAEQMKYGDFSPVINFQVPGEIRAAAFTISTPVKGNLPLFAVTGTFKQGCDNQDTFSLPFEPQFNEEFKVIVNHFRTDTVLAIAIPTNDKTQGAQFAADSVRLAGKDSVAEVPIVVNVASIAAEQYIVSVRLESPLPTVIDSMNMGDGPQVDSVVYADNRTSAKIFVRGPQSSELQGTVYLRSVTDDTLNSVMVTETEAKGVCLCKKPTLTDTVVITNVKEPIVSVKPDVHDNTEIRISQIEKTIQIQNHHEQPGTVSIVDLLGNTVASTLLNKDTVRLSLDYLQRGVYYVVVQTEGRYQVLKIEL